MINSNIFITAFLLALFGMGNLSLLVDRTTQQTVDSRLTYLVPAIPGVRIIPLLSVGEQVENGYRMVGKLDGLGAFDNGDGTFTVLINHELDADKSIEHKHGSKGAFISRWIVSKPDERQDNFKVLSGEDVIQIIFVWDTTSRSYIISQGPLSRLCSADLPNRSALFAKGIGTKSKIFLGGEENDAYRSGFYGRAFATVIDGPFAGNSYELPSLGNISFENVVASPHPQEKTVVVALDDATGSTYNTLGEVYVYIGNKQKEGNPIQQAGLTKGQLYGISIDDQPIEGLNYGLGYQTTSKRFQLKSVGDIKNDDGTHLFEITKANNTLGITKFFRPEDGAWDPNRPNTFYFATTGSNITRLKWKSEYDKAPGRLWALVFDNIEDPLQGGTIQPILNGHEGAKEPDNITVSRSGKILIQEDRGRSNALSRIWEYNIEKKALRAVAKFNPRHFRTKGPDFISRNEESSGIIDASHILGEGWYLLTAQIHLDLSHWRNFRNRKYFNLSRTIGKEVVKDGQLLAIYIPD